MKQLRIANSMIGDRKALDEAWERDGYWFFKGVLDPAAVDQVCQRFLAELEQFGSLSREIQAPGTMARASKSCPVGLTVWKSLRARMSGPLHAGSKSPGILPKFAG